jgi:rare lipoprotein A
MKKIYLFLTNILFASVLLANNKLPQTGLASYYADAMNHHHTACWDRYCKDSFTAAHRTLPFGTYIKVINLKNSKTVIVRINDRGPHKRHRIIDLSGAAADMLDIKRSGLGKVRIELASTEEVINFRKKYVDSTDDKPSIILDSSKNVATTKVIHPAIDDEIYMIQGGAYKTKKSADCMKNYLKENDVNQVVVKFKRARRQKLYKVLIGPLNTDEKEKALKVLKNKGVSGWVIRT